MANNAIDLCFGCADALVKYTVGYAQTAVAAGKKVLYAHFCGEDCSDFFYGDVTCIASKTVLSCPENASEEQKQIALADNTDLFEAALKKAAQGGFSVLIFGGISDAVAFDTLYEGLLTDFLREKSASLQLLITGCSVSAPIAFYADNILHFSRVERN